MAGPYIKMGSELIEDGWQIEDADGVVIAAAQTETLIDIIMGHLIGFFDQVPCFPIGEPVGEAEKDEDE